MRFLIATVAATLIAAPVAAQYRDAPPPEAELADRLNGPLVQHGIPAAMSGLLAALMDTRIGGFAQFTDPSEDIRPGDTLGDVVARDDPYFQQRVHADARRSTAMIGQMAGSIAAMIPELRNTADRLRDQVDSIDRDYYDR